MGKLLWGLVGVSLLCAPLAFLSGEQEQPKLRTVTEGVPFVEDDAGNKYPLGRVAPTKEQLKYAHSVSMKYAYKMNKMAERGVPDAYDAEQFGLIPPIKDQENCGSCHIFSALGPATVAQIKAGNWANKGDGYSEQEQLDCKNTGGCNGGWEWNDAEFLLTKGGALESEYGPYKARSGACKSGVKLHKIGDMAMCSPGVDGVARTIDIQNSIVEYGSVSVSVAADGAFSSYRSGLFNGSGSRQVNHAVMFTGWKTVSGVVYFKLRNSWGTGWGEKGYMWCKAGANQAGGDAFWIKVDSVSPPPPPPDPPPPPPPGPDPPPIGGRTISLRGFGMADGDYPVVKKGSIVVHRDSTFGEIMDALKAGKQLPSPVETPNDKRMDDLEKKLTEAILGIKRLTDRLGDEKKIGLPNPKE